MTGKFWIRPSLICHTWRWHEKSPVFTPGISVFQTRGRPYGQPILLRDIIRGQQLRGNIMAIQFVKDHKGKILAAGGIVLAIIVNVLAGDPVGTLLSDLVNAVFSAPVATP